MHVDVHVVVGALTGEVTQGQHRTLRAVAPLTALERQDVTSAHVPDQGLVVGCRHRQVGHHLAVLEHDDPVGNARELAHPVTDVQHPATRRDMTVHELEEQLGLGVGQDGRRLVEDEQPRVLVQRASDERELLLTEAEQVHPPLQQPDRQIEGLEQVTSLIAHGGPAEIPGPTTDLSTHEDVLEDGELREERRLLMHHCHAETDCLARRRGGVRLSLEGHDAAVRAHHAGQHLHQGRLACAVLSHDNDPFTCMDLDVDVLQRLGRPKRQGQALSAEQQLGQSLLRGRCLRVGVGHRLDQ